jgi:hypothetical protein
MVKTGPKMQRLVVKIRAGHPRFFRAFALASAKLKKAREREEKKSAKKSESAERERKKARIRAFLSLGG